MTDAKDLAARLRDWSEGPGTDALCAEAAALIEQQAAEIERLRGMVAKFNARCVHLSQRLADVAALAQPSTEPVAHIKTWHKNGEQHAELWNWGRGIESLADGEHLLYTAPPSTERKPLHGYELAKVVADAGAPELNVISASAVLSLIRAVERAVRGQR